MRVGNSAGVILPREWLNGRARVELVEKPLEIKKDILDILEPYLEDVIGIYLVGSYARGEQTEKSDVDVLVITNEINKKIERGRYSFILISREKVEDSLKTFILPILPMLIEARALLNEDFIEEYRKTELTERNLRFHLEITKSGANVNKAFIDLDKENGSNCSDANVYSLVLHIRSTYIVDCLRKGKKWSSREFIKLIKNIAGSTKAYERYLRVKNDKKREEELPVKEAENLYNYLIRKIKEQEEWIKRKS